MTTFALLLCSLIFFRAQTANADSASLTVKAIEPREAKAYQYDKAMQVHSNSDFTFEAEAKPVVTEIELRLDGTLSNGSNETKTAYVSSKTPFVLELTKSDGVESKSTPRQTPELYVVDLPPRSKVPFTATVPLSQLTYTGEPTGKFKWTFKFWSDPRPSGTLEFKLPVRSTDALKLSIDRYDNAQTKSAKLIATLTNISPAPQIYCRGETLWSDASKTAPTPSETAPQNKPVAKAEDCKVLNPQESLEVETATLKDGDLKSPSTTLKKVKTVKVEVRNGATQDLAAKVRAPAPMRTVEATLAL